MHKYLTPLGLLPGAGTRLKKREAEIMSQRPLIELTRPGQQQNAALCMYRS